MQPILEINLDHLLKNYQLCQKTASNSEISAVVKANAYGLGAPQIAQKLSQNGCKTFFVAYLDEAIEILDYITPDSKIYILHGIKDFKALSQYPQIHPVINSHEALKAIQTHAPNLKYWLHIDTGINRLGVSFKAFDDSLLNSNCVGIMSHFACADTKDHSLNKIQYERFKQLTDAFPNLQKSLSASSGLFLNAQYHFDLIRAGICLYGGYPNPEKENLIHPVITVKVKILQKTILKKGETTGYGATFIAKKNMRIGTLAIGYADGLFRSLFDKGEFIYKGKALKILGIISMDLCVIDLSELSEPDFNMISELEILNNSYTINHMAKDAGTIPYEILTNLGHRFKRIILENGIRT